MSERGRGEGEGEGEGERWSKCSTKSAQQPPDKANGPGHLLPAPPNTQRDPLLLFRLLGCLPRLAPCIAIAIERPGASSEAGGGEIDGLPDLAGALEEEEKTNNRPKERAEEGISFVSIYRGAFALKSAKKESGPAGAGHSKGQGGSALALYT